MNIWKGLHKKTSSMICFIYISSFILWGEDEGSFSMIDEELLVYVDLIIKKQRFLFSHFPQ